MKCRNCKSSLKQKLIDLGTCPPSNSYLDIVQIQSKKKNTFHLKFTFVINVGLFKHLIQIRLMNYLLKLILI